MTKPSSQNSGMAIAAGLAFVTVMAANFPLLAAKPATLIAAELIIPPTTSEAEPRASTPTQPQATKVLEDTGRDNASDVEIHRRFNDLRRELLDNQAKTVDW